MGTTKQYKAICFDLDDTLYDSSYHFEQGVKNSFRELHPDLDADAAFDLLKERTYELWDSFEEGKINLQQYRRLRFLNGPVLGKTFDEKMADEFHQHYLAHLADYIRPFAGLYSLMEQLSKEYQLAIITNGPADAQWLKVKCLGIDPYFPQERLFISGEVGIAKPHAQIFHYALDKLGVETDEALHVGDSYLHDAEGARKAGLDAVWLNRWKSDQAVDPSIRVIYELKELLPL